MTFRTVLAIGILTIGQGQDTLTDALSLARTHDQALYDAFNAGYMLAASGAVERVEVVTEFRRAVLLARQRVEQGEYGFTARDLANALAPDRGRVGLIAVVRLNPLNTFARPPAYDLYVQTGPRSAPLAAGDLTREPVYPPGLSKPGTAMTAVRLRGTFDRADLAAAASPTLVITDQDGTALWHGRLDLSRYR